MAAYETGTVLVQVYICVLECWLDPGDGGRMTVAIAAERPSA